VRAKKITKKLLPKVTKGKISNEVGQFPVDHYSYSSLVQFSSNPILFKIKYINKDRFDTVMGISAIIGQSFHRAMEVYYGDEDGKTPVNESEAIEFALKAGMEYLEAYNDGFINFTTTIPNKQKAFDLLSFAFNSYVSVKPYDNENETVISIEEKLEEYVDVEWNGKALTLPVKLKGYTDKIVRVGDKLKIVDYKVCSRFSDSDKIDGAKIIQAVQYYLLAYAKYGEQPYSMIFEEVKMTKNSDGTSQVREYEIIFSENSQYFDLYFRLYQDITRALNGEMVYVPNFYAMFDNEVAMIAYIHHLDIEEETAKLLKKHQVDNLTDLLKKEIHKASNMSKLLKAVEKQFVEAKAIDYSKMTNEDKIRTKLLEHGMLLQFDSKIEGSTVDMYRYSPSIGLKMARIRTYADDIEQVLGISGIRVLAPIQGSTLVGFEVPRVERTFPTLPSSKGFELAIGQTIDGRTKYFDIREAPHMLVAGSTGSGKSVFLHSIIKQLIKLPNVELFLMDPKQVELSQYEEDVMEYRHSHSGILASLESLVEEMERRYTVMKKLKIKNISETADFNYKFVIIDEYADLAMKEQTGNTIKLLAQKGRACGIHIILATQRASAKVIDGDIKVNFPTKVVFRMGKVVDSMVMLDESGAEKLLGKGDMLFSNESGIERLQGFNS